MYDPRGKILDKTRFMTGRLVLLFSTLAVTAVLFFLPQVAKGAPPALEPEAVKLLPKIPEGTAQAIYPDSSWDPEVLRFLHMGPAFLPKDTAFEVPAFPANDSPETSAELETLKNFAANLRTPETVKHIVFENDMPTPLVSYEEVGLFSSEKNPEAEELITKVVVDAGVFIISYKKEFLRVRPDFLAPDLKTVIPNPGHPAYPSGHGGQSHIVGLILAMLDEKHKDIYMAHAWAIGTRREIAGVHYPSDSVAGRKLAEDVLAKLMKVPEFQEQLKEAKASFVAPDESAFENYKPLIIDPALIVKPETPEPSKQ